MSPRSVARVSLCPPLRRWIACGGVLLGLAAVQGADPTASGIRSEPLAPRTGGTGPTLFTAVPAAQSGLVAPNDYADPRMWGERFHESGVGEIGTGVTIGDYDGDGRPDVFVVSKVETCRLFRNLGGGRFEDVTVRAGVADNSGEWKQGATFADVDNDGWLDLYVCRLGAPNLLFMNRHDGTFREEAGARGLAIVDASAMAAFADYDRDGWLDVYVHTNLLSATEHPNGQPDYLFHNNGDGTFTNVTGRAGIAGETQGHSATWWDYNEDGWPDIYVANDFAVPDFLYRNNRDGTFTKVTGLVLPRTPGTAMGSDLGDVNNDGRVDFLVADMAATTPEKDQRGMSDTRGMNRDSEPADPAVAPQIQRNALYVATGTGAFLEAADLAGLGASDWTWSVRFEDLDCDGRLDLQVNNGMDREQTNLDLLTAMMRAETGAERVRLMKSAPVLNETNLAFRNLGGLRFEEVGAQWGLNEHGVSFGAAYGDLDGDGDLDLVSTNFQKGPTFLRNDGTSGHRVIVALEGRASNRFGVGAVVRVFTASGQQVRPLTLARGYLSASEPVLHFGLGDDERIDRLEVVWPSGHYQSFAGLAADRKYIVTEPAGPAASEPPPLAAATWFRESAHELGLDWRSREEPLEGTVGQPGLPFRLNRRGPGLAVGDLDGDGTNEIVLAATTRDPVRVLTRRAGRYVERPLAALAKPPHLNAGPPLILDFSGTGRGDLLLTAGGAALPAEEPEYEPSLLLSGADGALQPAAAGTLPSFPVSVGAVAAADYDRDGRLDLFVGGRAMPGYYPETPPSALWHQQDGRWVDVTAKIAPALHEVGMVTSAVWSDVDGDGWIDLVVALDGGGLRYFRNNGGTAFAEQTTEAGFDGAGTGLWTALASGDFNGDGRPDFAVGNLGLNTPFHASAESACVLLAGDFNGSGTPQLIPAFEDKGRLLPRPSRRELAAFLPDVMKRFPRNDVYARSALPDILGADRLAKATRLRLTELRSGVLLSSASGRYRFVPLPHLAQGSPVQGLVAADFDGDGNTDLFAAQNSFAPSAAIGRFAGGLGVLLRGDGHGEFTVVEPARSGVVIPGDAKSAAVADVNDDGRPDVIVTRNNSTTLAFVNQSPATGAGLAVTLRGKPGNRAALGARVRAELRDGSFRTLEVFGGGGFASQSTATAFIGALPANPAVRIEVRWPDGAVTRHDVPADARQLTVTE